MGRQQRRDFAAAAAASRARGRPVGLRMRAAERNSFARPPLSFRSNANPLLNWSTSGRCRVPAGPAPFFLREGGESLVCLLGLLAGIFTLLNVLLQGLAQRLRLDDELIERLDHLLAIVSAPPRWVLLEVGDLVGDDRAQFLDFSGKVLGRHSHSIAVEPILFRILGLCILRRRRGERAGKLACLASAGRAAGNGKHAPQRERRRHTPYNGARPGTDAGTANWSSMLYKSPLGSEVSPQATTDTS